MRHRDLHITQSISLTQNLLLDFVLLDLSSTDQGGSPSNRYYLSSTTSHTSLHVIVSGLAKGGMGENGRGGRTRWLMSIAWVYRNPVSLFDQGERYMLHCLEKPDEHNSVRMIKAYDEQICKEAGRYA